MEFVLCNCACGGNLSLRTAITTQCCWTSPINPTENKDETHYPMMLMFRWLHYLVVIVIIIQQGTCHPRNPLSNTQISESFVYSFSFVGLLSFDLQQGFKHRTPHLYTPASSRCHSCYSRELTWSQSGFFQGAECIHGSSKCLLMLLVFHPL